MRNSITKGEMRMIKRMAGVLFAAALVLVLAVPANAVEDGSIRVVLDVGDRAVTNGAVTLYRVGVPISGGYRLLEAFGGGVVREEDAFSPYLAQWLAQSAQNGTTLLLDADGCAEFSRLDDGLYLLTQTEDMDGFYRIEPFLVSIPYEGVWNLQANPKTQPIADGEVWQAPPATGQHPAPILGAMGLVVSGVGLFLCLGRKKRK